jgi:2',3'-cyclic-nucleotide 3'-phosphodiesterase
MDLQKVVEDLDCSTPTVFIMRGLPGSGKSTAAKKIQDDYNKASFYCTIVSADNYWINREGEYVFDATQVPKNHHWCLRNFICDLQSTMPDGIVVDNTNLAPNEFLHYAKIAQAYGYKVVVLTFPCYIDDSVKRNTHNVPKSTIISMFNRMDHSKDAVERLIKTEKIDAFTIDIPSSL